MEGQAINLNLDGKTALVCGASQGIGAATARELAQLGAQVVVLARSGSKLNAIVAELPGKGHEALAIDLSSRELLEEKIQDLVSRRGPIEILICNGGGPKGGLLTEAKAEEFIQAFGSHLLANNLLVRMLVPGMRSRQYGRIVNIISTSVKAPIANLGVSNTIRGAVANWAKTLSLELAIDGITVNNVLPGYTKTPRLDSLLEAAALKQGKERTEVAAAWRATIPAGRFAESSEVAAAIAFLASPAASYINGINVPVDGGRTQSL